MFGIFKSLVDAQPDGYKAIDSLTPLAKTPEERTIRIYDSMSSTLLSKDSTEPPRQQARRLGEIPPPTTTTEICSQLWSIFLGSSSLLSRRSRLAQTLDGQYLGHVWQRMVYQVLDQKHRHSRRRRKARAKCWRIWPSTSRPPEYRFFKTPARSLPAIQFLGVLEVRNVFIPRWARGDLELRAFEYSNRVGIHTLSRLPKTASAVRGMTGITQPQSQRHLILARGPAHLC
ncbi:Uu.00g133560.m01.CDS01 [Anthostomella pinea]|uniref:Uu.00g133560.m01.CDS01 n=1 Tax=Anthostomella pinea TaxID=933095 RepID=A0AAI8VNT4_9PEZI|nr:Uu.00g133560.m01.CDS01 [Anthostomella pinea]